MHPEILFLVLAVAGAFCLLKTTDIGRQCRGEQYLQESAKQGRLDKLILTARREGESLILISASGREAKCPVSWLYEGSVINPSETNFGPERKRIYLWEETSNGKDFNGQKYALRKVLPVSLEAYKKIKECLKLRPHCEAANELLLANFHKARGESSFLISAR